MGACTALGVKSMAMVAGWVLELPPELPHPANASAASTTAVSRRTTAGEGTGAGAPLLRCPAGWAWFDGDDGVRTGRAGARSDLRSGGGDRTLVAYRDQTSVTPSLVPGWHTF